MSASEMVGRNRQNSNIRVRNTPKLPTRSPTSIFVGQYVPQLLWFKKIRRNALLMYPIVLLINVGMWFERFVIVVVSLHRDFLPSSWGTYWPTKIDLGLLAGSFGVFLTLILLFCRFLPTISLADIKAVAPGAQPRRGGNHD